MKIVYFVLIVAVAAFCGALTGTVIICVASQGKRKKRRPPVAGQRPGDRKQ